VISEAPAKAANDLVSLSDKVSAYVAVAKVKAADGLTVAEFSELIVSALPILIAALDVSSLPGAERKATVVDFVGTMFDQFSDRCIPIYFVPIWWIIKPSCRSLALAWAGGAVESLLPIVRGAK
jgi:hypothetical protein